MKKNLIVNSMLIVLFLALSLQAEEKRKRISMTKETREAVLGVLDANEELHASFFSYEGKDIEKKATVLKSKIEEIKNEDISKLLSFAKSKLSDIKASNKRDKNNENYHIVSSALIYIVNKYDVGPGYNAYSCPMVNKKWVQNSNNDKKTRNPYSKEMPHCGSKDTDH